MEPNAALERVLDPIETARGLPNVHYIDAAMHERECERVFRPVWAAVGFGKDVAAPGDAFPVDFLGQPLVLVRGRDDTVRVFQNTCRHRGMILVDAPKSLRGMIRCPYHSWCYDLNGDLRSTPHVGGAGHNVHPAIDRTALGLVEIRSHVWQDVVFVNLDGQAPPFEKAHAVLLERWVAFEQPGWFGGADSQFELTIRSNWKLAVENYCESYHLPWVHPGLNSYSRLEDHYHIVEPGKFSGQGTRVYDPRLSEIQAFPDFTGLFEVWNRQAEYVSLFPNVLLGVHRDHRYAIVLLPDGPTATTERVAIYYADEAAAGEAFAELRKTNAGLWKGIFEEDIGVVEGMQAGRRGQAFDGGKFSPVMDEPTWLFHRWIAGRMLTA